MIESCLQTMYEEDNASQNEFLNNIIKSLDWNSK